MSVNLLDIDVESLFEQFSVSDIDQVHSKLQSSIEEKKEELRVMVGERYRDLLQAADTIADMQKTSSNVIGKIDAVIKNCQNVNEQHLIGFRTESKPKNENILLKNADYYGCVAQIHLLTTLPELIWSRLDDGDYFVATQLFILSRYISTGLQLDAKNCILNSFPVAKRQCAHLNQFFFVIKQLCVEQLEHPELGTETAVKCLASLLFLENCKLEKLLTMFIQLRTRAFRLLFASHTSVISKAKDRILSSLKMLNETLLLIYMCFSNSNENGKSPLLLELEQISGPNAQPTINLLNLENEAIKRSLPGLIFKFKPQLNDQQIETNVIKTALDSWMKTTADDAKTCLSDVINNISSIRTIHNINHAVLETGKPKEWPQILQQLHLEPTMNFYEKFYRPLLRNRVQTIVKSAWSTAVNALEKDISSFLDASDAKWTISKSFWIDDSMDNPLSLKQALSSKREDHKLLMKVKGFGDSICTICNNFDQSTESIYNDLNLYINSDEKTNGLTSKSDVAIDVSEQEQIVEHLRKCSQDGINELIGNIKLLAYERTEQQNLIFLAKLLKAITEICPNIKQCLIPTSLLLSLSWNESTTVNQQLTPSSEHWDRMCRLLDEESLNLWKRWIELFINDRLQSNNDLCFSIDINVMNLLTILPKWDAITIEEKDESNQSVESKIRIPSHPSIPLQQFLFNCCRQLNNIVPNTLPKQVSILLTEQLVNKIIETYAQLLSKDDFVKLNQNASLQFYFDMKFISIMLLSGRRCEQLQELIINLKSNIDPFDFELFHKYLNNNVKISAQRMQHHFGILIPNNQHLNSILSSLPKQLNTTITEKSPNVLPLCSTDSNHTWFTLLPIVVTPKYKENVIEPTVNENIQISDKVKQEKNVKRSSPSKSTLSQSMTQQNLANVKSNAAAFFGAMSQDWFK